MGLYKPLLAAACVLVMLAISASGAAPVTFTWNGPQFTKGPQQGQLCTIGQPFCILGDPNNFTVYQVKLTSPGTGKPNPNNWDLEIQTNYGTTLPGVSEVIPPYFDLEINGTFGMGDFLIVWNGVSYGIVMTAHDGYTPGNLYLSPNGYRNSQDVLSTQPGTNIVNPNFPILIAPGAIQVGVGSLAAGPGTSPAKYKITDSFSAPANFLAGSTFTIYFSSYACGNSIVMGAPVIPPSLTKQFATHVLAAPNTPTTVTFTVQNTTAATITNVVVTDPMPSPFSIINNVFGGTCTTATFNGVVALTPASPPSTSFTLTIPSMGPNTSCTLVLNVTGTATTTGCVQNTANITFGPANTPGAPATDCMGVNLTVLPPTVSKTYPVKLVPINTCVAMNFTLSNTNAATALTNVTFVSGDNLPFGLTLCGSPAPSGTCLGSPYNGQITPIGSLAGAGQFNITIATFAANSSCTLSLSVQAAGTYIPQLNSVTITSTQGVGNTSSDILTTLPIPPTISKQFSPAIVPINSPSTLALTLCNPNSATNLLGVNFNDPFVAPLTVATPPNAVNGCGGTLTAVAGASSIALSGVTLPAATCCTVQVNVVSPTVGLIPNLTTNITSTTPVLTGNQAPNTLQVIPPPPPPPNTSYLVSYASNLNIADSYVDITNFGTVNGNDTAGRLCANVYVFDANEEPVACCSCPVTPNGLVSLSVSNIISKPLTPNNPTSVVIKLLGSTPNGGSCDAANPTPLARGLGAWRTTIHALGPANAASPSWQQTDVPFTISELSESEYAKLRAVCSFIQTYGSSFGMCKGCQNFGRGAQKQ